MSEKIEVEQVVIKPEIVMEIQMERKHLVEKIADNRDKREKLEWWNPVGLMAQRLIKNQKAELETLERFMKQVGIPLEITAQT